MEEPWRVQTSWEVHMSFISVETSFHVHRGAEAGSKEQEHTQEVIKRCVGDTPEKREAAEMGFCTHTCCALGSPFLKKIFFKAFRTSHLAKARFDS